MTGLSQTVRERLRDVLDPCSVAAGNSMDIVEMGLIRRLEISDGHLDVYLCLTSPTCPMLEHFAKESRRVLADVAGVDTIELHGDTGMDWTADRLSPQARSRRLVHLTALRERPAPVTGPIDPTETTR